MSPLRREARLTGHELAWLARELTDNQHDELLDAGWTDLGAKSTSP
jgi:hypothetical protein